LAAEATRLERALTKPLETEDLDDDLSLVLEPNLNNVAPATEGTRAPTPKNKQPAKKKSASKITTEGMYSQYLILVMVSCLILD
jgi:hypothetical protein